MEFRVIIPARYGSTRFPGKVLVDIAGKPMIQHVYERAMESGAESVVIATDDKRIAEVAKSFDAPVCFTSENHTSGTERLAEAVEALEYGDDEIVVNVQGDEPLIPPDVIAQLAQDLDEHDNVRVCTLCEPITNIEDLFNPNVVKVVLNRRNYAMYFSRATIPWERDEFVDKKNINITGNHFRHCGLFAYRVQFLRDYINWPASPLESIEKLEQLRILWYGARIHVSVAKRKLPPDVNTKDDLKKVMVYLKEHKKSGTR